MDRRAAISDALTMVKRATKAVPPGSKVRKPLFISEWLAFLGKTQTWLSEETGYSEPYISLLASGKKRHNQDVEEAFEAALELEPGMLRRKPAEDDIWTIWQGLNPDQRKMAVRHIRAIKGD